MATDPNTRTVLITGCSSGIGQATAERLAQAGWNVFASARKAQSLEHLRQRGCKTLALDVTDEASMQAAVDAVQSQAGGIDALVNNAGYSQSGAVESVTPAQARAQFETNVFGLMRLTQLVLPGMRACGHGRIVNISSMGGTLTFPGGGWYHASKYALEALSDALRVEVKRFGVQVVVVQPGLIRTAFDKAALAALDGADAAGPYAEFNRRVGQATQEAYEKGPLARLGGEPDAVAKVIERALSARHPRARYTVTPSARLLMTMRRMMSDRAWDGFVASQFGL
ncbi:MAG: SDR family NAD(P)-dependent oxidoreductase [Nevskia sp.]|nr:SDR family NAD(P)-dependent oxidoreductase [Nevskia sp.]